MRYRPPGFLGALALVLVPRLAAAHNVPIDPSLCTPEIEIAVPGIAVRAVAAPAGANDRLRLLYDTSQSVVQLCPADPAALRERCAKSAPARPLAGLGLSSSLTLPVAFQARLLATGELVATQVPVLLSLDGIDVTLPVTLTTGPAAAGDEIADASAAPLGATGALALTGAVLLDGFPPPLAGEAAVFRVTCTVDPPPDLDQFAAPARTTFGGTITASGMRLRARVVEGADAVDPTGRPTVVQVRVGGEVLGPGVAAATDGLTARSQKRFVYESPSGLKAIDLRRVRRKPTPVWSVRLDLEGAVTPFPRDGTEIELVYDLGGAVGRVTRIFRAKRGGTRLTAR
jgi:hypothetical protein